MINGFGGELFRYNKKQKYICFDTETESLCLLEKNRPWQIAATFATGFEIESTKSVYIKWPDLNVSKGAAVVTGFDERVVNSEGKEPKEVLSWLESYIYDPEYRVIWFNGLNFDVYIHNIWRKELGLPPDFSYVANSIDVNTLYKAHKLGVNLKSEDNLIEFQYRFCSFHQRGFKTNLAQGCRDYNIATENESYHDAGFDTVQTFRLFEAIVKAMDI